MCFRQGVTKRAYMEYMGTETSGGHRACAIARVLTDIVGELTVITGERIVDTFGTFGVHFLYWRGLSSGNTRNKQKTPLAEWRLLCVCVCFAKVPILKASTGCILEHIWESK